jgi:hypothetical protein
MSTCNENSISLNTTSSFCKTWDWFKTKYGKVHYKIEFCGQNNFTEVIRDHFKDLSRKGVYIIFETKSNSAIYIGKGGTINQDGTYKTQDIEGRLTNTRKNKSATYVFGEYHRKYGNIRIEYISLPLDCSPSLVEAYLLQAFLNEKGTLPLENQTL